MSEAPGGTGRPMSSLPMSPHGHQISPAHRTVLPEEDERIRTELAQLVSQGPPSLVDLQRFCATHPASLDGWARLGQAHYLAGDDTSAYACARVGYHRGLDRLRRSGWGGSGQVRWEDETNRGFLRALQLLMLAAAAIGELDEMARCHQFLLDLDPNDGIRASEEDLPGARREAAQLA